MEITIWWPAVGFPSAAGGNFVTMAPAPSAAQNWSASFPFVAKMVCWGHSQYSNTKEQNMALPEIGSRAAAFTLANQDGKQVSLADYAGRHVLLWFFPRAFGGN